MITAELCILIALLILQVLLVIDSLVWWRVTRELWKRLDDLEREGR